jgi:HEPN domain-containing protein
LPRRTDSNNPADWLAIAESELACVRLLTERLVGYDMCQSKLAEILEKILKAELIRHGWFLEKTHDVERLRKELRTRDAALADQIEPLCLSLAELYFTGRYPGFDLDDPDWPDFRSKLDDVARLLAVVKARINGN